MDEQGLQKIGALSVKMLDVLEEEFKKLEAEGNTKIEIGIVHIAVEVMFEEDGDEWEECFVQSDERRGWVKSAFLSKLSDASEEMLDVEMTEDDEDEE